MARVYEQLGEATKAVAMYKKVLVHDASNAEAIASLAAHHFYTDQPEIALKFYRRLLQMGLNNTELWNNLGLCCFYASQVRRLWRTTTAVVDYRPLLPCFAATACSTT